MQPFKELRPTVGVLLVFIFIIVLCTGLGVTIINEFIPYLQELWKGMLASLISVAVAIVYLWAADEWEK